MSVLSTKSVAKHVFVAEKYENWISYAYIGKKVLSFKYQCIVFFFCKFG